MPAMNRQKFLGFVETLSLSFVGLSQKRYINKCKVLKNLEPKWWLKWSVVVELLKREIKRN